MLGVGGEGELSVLSQEEMLCYNAFLVRPECVEMNFEVFVFLFCDLPPPPKEKHSSGRCLVVLRSGLALLFPILFQNPFIDPEFK